MKNKILVVDDDEGILKTLGKILQFNGYQVLKAISGKEAINTAKKEIPQMVIMDIMLPDLDGPEAVKVLQENPATAEIPILFLSSIIDKEIADSSHVRVGDKVYEAIAKPISSRELIDKMKKVLKDASS